MLSGIDLDSGNRILEAEYKLEKNVRIARLYLEDDDAVNAEAFIKKASFLLPSEPAAASTQAKVLTLQYRVCYARIQVRPRMQLIHPLRCPSVPPPHQLSPPSARSRRQVHRL